MKARCCKPYKMPRFLKIGLMLIPLHLGMGCSVGYILTNGWYQAKLLYGSKPIKNVLKDKNLSTEAREQLELILEVREFSREVLHLEPGENYTTINMGWKHYIHNVAACHALAFESYTWCFPIIGCVPYKGYFIEEDAIKEANRLKQEGYDVALRPVGGYSTLGYFKDPVWPQMLKRPKGLLAELMIHELAHRTLYFKNQSQFNESFANYIGKTGALLFLEKKFGKESEYYRQLVDYYHDEKIYEKWMWEQYQALNQIYTSQDALENKKLKKEKHFLSMRENYQKLPLKTEGFKRINPSQLNNADLMNFRLYHSEQNQFEALLACLKNDFKGFMGILKNLEKSNNPISEIEKHLCH